jgi:hypothetical protein
VAPYLYPPRIRTSLLVRALGSGRVLQPVRE